MYSTGNKTVDIVGTMDFQGNIIPHTWYGQFKFDSGKPDYLSMLLLSEVVYWYRPSYVRDEQSGMVKAVKKKFKADLLQKDYESLEAQFGVSKKMLREAFERLEAKGLIKRIFRHQKERTNIMFIELNPTALAEFTFPHLREKAEEKEAEGTETKSGNDDHSLEGTMVIPQEEPSSFPGGNNGHSLEGTIYTKNTKQRLLTKNTTENKEIYNVATSATEDNIPYAEIIAYFNQVVSQSLKDTTKAYRKLIKARFGEGYTLDDFKRVIDNKYRAWKNDSRMKKFLRPSTLFGEKFDEYLNEGGGKSEVATTSDGAKLDFTKAKRNDFLDD